MPKKHQPMPAGRNRSASSAAQNDRQSMQHGVAGGMVDGASDSSSAGDIGRFWKNQWSDSELDGLLSVLRSQYGIELEPEIEATLRGNPVGRSHIMQEALSQLASLDDVKSRGPSDKGWKLRTAGTLAEILYGNARSGFPSLNPSGDMSSLYLPKLPALSDGFNPDWSSQNAWGGPGDWDESDSEDEDEASETPGRPAIFSVHGGALSSEDAIAPATSEGARTAWASWLSTWLPAGLAARIGFQSVPTEEVIEMAAGAAETLMEGGAAAGRAGRRAGSALKTVALGVGATVLAGGAALGVWWWRNRNSPHETAATSTSGPDVAANATSAMYNATASASTSTSSPSAAASATTSASSTSEKWINFLTPDDHDQRDSGGAAQSNDTTPVISPQLEASRTSALSGLGDASLMLTNLLDTIRNVSAAAPSGTSIDNVLGDERVDGQSKSQLFKAVLAHMNITLPSTSDPVAWAPISQAVLQMAESEVEQLFDDVNWMKMLLNNADGHQLQSLNGLISQMQALRLQGLSQRNWWKAVTFGRIFYGLHELKASTEYKNLVSGYGNLLSVAQKRLEVEWFSTNFLSQTRQHFESTFGINANNINSAVAQKYREWEGKVKANYDDLLTPQNQQKLREFNAFMQTNIPDASKQKEYKSFLGQGWMQALKLELNSELEKLPEHVLSGSKYKKFQERAGVRFKELQGGRVMASIPAAMGVPAKIVQMVYANATTQQRTLAGFDAFYELLAAIKVPYTFGLQAYEASKGGKSLAAHSSEFFQTYRDYYHSTVGSHSGGSSDLSSFMGHSEHGQGHSFGVEMGKHGELTAELRKHLSAYAKRDPNGWRTVNGILGELKNQGPYLTQDALGLIMDAYRYGVAQNLTATEDVAAIFGIISSAAYLEATTADVFLKGPGVTQFVRFANAGGVVNGVVSGVAGIAAMVQKGASQRNIALASIQLVVNNMAIMGSIAFPVCGTLLAMFVPNFSAIGKAIDLSALANDLDRRGRTLEAKVARKLRGLAIADSIPVVNWFSFAYTAAAMNSADVTNDAEADIVVADAFVKELNSTQLDVAWEMSETFGGTPVYPARVLPFNVSAPYVQTNPQRTPQRPGNTLSIHRHVSSWVVLKKESGHYYLTDGQATTRVKVNSERPGNYGPYPGFFNQSAVREKLFARREVESVSAMPDPHRPELFKITARGPSDPPLVLNNARSNRPGIYATQKNPGAKLTGGSKDDLFLLLSMPQLLDGGAGVNTAQFVGSAGNTINIDMRKFRNIQTVYGSNNTASVTGTDGADTYIADKQGRENINLGAGDDRAIVMGGRIDMGSGDDMVQALGLPDRMEGGPGTDMVSFENSGLMGFTINGNRIEAARRHNATDAPREMGGRRMTDMTEEQVIRMVETAQSFSDPQQNTLSGFEIVRTTENSDDITLTSGTDVKWLSLGDGNDIVRLDAVSDIQIHLGSGNDTLISRAVGQSYSNMHVRGNGGNNLIDVELNGGKNIFIASGDGDDSIILRAAAGSTHNEATVQTGGGSDSVRINGDMSLFFRVGDADGITHVYDNVGRSSPLFITFGGALSHDDVSVWTAIDDSGQEDAARNKYAIKVTLRTPDDKTLFVLHTSIAPNLVVVTEKDGRTWIPTVS